MLLDIVSSPLNLSLLGLCLFLLYQIVRGERQRPAEPQGPPPLPPLKRRDFTLEQLRPFDGVRDPRILMAIRGRVFDVSRASKFYGPGAGKARRGGPARRPGVEVLGSGTGGMQYPHLSLTAACFCVADFKTIDTVRGQGGGFPSFEKLSLLGSGGAGAACMLRSWFARPRTPTPSRDCCALGVSCWGWGSCQGSTGDLMRQLCGSCHLGHRSANAVGLSFGCFGSFRRRSS